MNNQQLNEYIKTVVSFSFDANKYFNDSEPWAVKKNDPERMNAILFTIVEQIKNISILLNPIIPNATNKVLAMINISEQNISIDKIKDDNTLNNKLELGNFLAPIPYRKFTLAICWNGVGPMEFKGRSTQDILRDFAITNRKLNTNLEGHRYGIAKFITNFKNLCSRYFGFDTWDDDAFLSCCIQAGLFNENEQREII